MTSGVRVTAEDLSGKEPAQSAVIKDNYIVITAGSCYVAHTQMSANGTHVLTIKGKKSR